MKEDTSGSRLNLFRVQFVISRQDQAGMEELLLILLEPFGDVVFEILGELVFAIRRHDSRSAGSLANIRVPCGAGTGYPSRA